MAIQPSTWSTYKHHNTLLGITFTKEKSQLSAMEVTETSMIANIHIHVERVIGNVRQ